jgi:2-desacetyl-2-hydroxyethyl bacteriochlorophyllide A dehydrogenase
MIAAIINSFGNHKVFELADIPIPKVEENQVLVRICAASINPVDFKSRRGFHKYILGYKFPIVLGYDMAGEVVETGSMVTQFKPGDRVHGRSNKKYGGTYAQFCTTGQATLCHIPPGIGFNEAAAVPLAAQTALQALRNLGKIKMGDKILITGATGGVGHFAVQLAKHFGAKVYAVSSPRHKEYIQQIDPYRVIDYTRDDYRKIKEKFDIVLDAAGKESFMTCGHLIKRGGVFISLLPRPKILLHKLVSFFVQKKVKTFLMKSNHYDLDFVNTLIGQGAVKVKIDRTFKLQDIANAHEYAEKGHTEGKIVIEVEHG